MQAFSNNKPCELAIFPLITCKYHFFFIYLPCKNNNNILRSMSNKSQSIAKWFIVVLTSYLFINVNAVAQTVEQPKFDRSDTPSFHVTKVEVTKDTTYVFCSYYAEVGSWANISADTYLRDVSSNKKYQLIKSIGFPYSPDKRDFVYDERCEIKLCFKPIGSVTKFDLLENPQEKAFNIYGIDLKSQYEKKYLDTDINRLSTMSSFYDSSGDSIKAIQYKKNEIEAVKYIYGIASEEYMSSLSLLCILYDKYNFQKREDRVSKYYRKRFKEDMAKKLVLCFTHENYCKFLFKF